MKKFSTVKVAKMVGIGWTTLHRWIVEGKVEAPPVESLEGFNVRLWTEDDIVKIREYKAEHYWGKGGRKKSKRRAK
jgi:predicted site-specific integrase-resolvase